MHSSQNQVITVCSSTMSFVCVTVFVCASEEVNSFFHSLVLYNNALNLITQAIILIAELYWC